MYKSRMGVNSGSYLQAMCGAKADTALCSCGCVHCMYLWWCRVPAPLSPHSMRPTKNPSAQLQQLRVTLGSARSAFVAASNKAPAVIKRTPWFKALEESVLPHLQPKPEGDTAAGDSSCPETCLNLRLISSECCVLGCGVLTWAGLACSEQARLGCVGLCGRQGMHPNPPLWLPLTVPLMLLVLPLFALLRYLSFPTCTAILKRDATNKDSCLCLRAALEEAGRHLDSMWRDGMIVMLCLAVLAIIGMWV